MSIGRRELRLALAVLAALAALLAVSASASADPFGVTEFDGEVLDSAGEPFSQAGGHPDSASTTIRFATHEEVSPFGPIQVPNEDIRDVTVDLPLGFVGDADATPVRCSEAGLVEAVDYSTQAAPPRCPVDSQVGVVDLVGFIQGWLPITAKAPLYAMEPPKGVAAQFGFRVLSNPIHLDAMVRPEDNGVRVRVRNVPQALTVNETSVKLWGVPASPEHDSERGFSCVDVILYGGLQCYTALTGPAGYAPVPFITNPTNCTAAETGLTTDLAVRSWPGSTASASFVSHDNDDQPLGPTGCDLLPFDPSLELEPAESRAGTPSAVSVDLSIPQNDNPDGLSSAHLKRAEVTLPEGMTVNPASASGLEACSAAQIGLGSADPVRCPTASRIGTVEVHTPLLPDTLGGSVYLAAQGDNPFSSLLALYLVVESEERGITVKLPGRVTPDPETGRLTATFDDNPQLPFSSMRLRFKGGPRAALMTPSTCGTHTTVARFVPWSAADPMAPTADEVVTRTSTFEITSGPDGGPCGPRSFAPDFAAGTASPVAGRRSPFSLALSRTDADAELATISELRLPKGLLGQVADVPLCAAAEADAGTCGAGSRIGHAQVAAGAGSLPLWLPEPNRGATAVYLAGPYRGAPYSLSVVVPAQAGPFDLGRVVVRSPLNVDPESAQLSTSIAESRVYGLDGGLQRMVEGGMPTIVEGIPLRIREVRVLVDRPGFTFNPTSCTEQSIAGTVAAVDGARAAVRSRFQVADCQALGFAPRMAMRLSGRRQTRTGGHPGFTTVLTQKRGQANIGAAKVTLPRSVVLDPLNTVDPKMLCGYDESLKADCPASSVIGRAIAVTPVLGKPLSGDVHLVQGIKFGKAGNRIRTTPSLLVKLRGEVAINLRARTTTERGTNRLVTTFPAVPDAPVSKFTLRISGGKKGILVVTRTASRKLNLCSARQVADVETDGQNGKRADYRTVIRTPCGGKANTGRKARRR